MLKIVTVLMCDIAAGLGLAGVIFFFRKFLKERNKLKQIQSKRITGFEDYLPSFYCLAIIAGCLCLMTIFLIAGVGFLTK